MTNEIRLKAVAIGVVVASALCRLPAAAQTDERRGWGYVFAAAGAATNGNSQATFQVGGGGEGRLFGGFALGAEVGYLAHARLFDAGFGTLSLDAAYHFGAQELSRRLVPFLTGGVSLAFSGRSATGGGNIGGGVQYWFRRRAAVRFEIRDQIFSSDNPHFWGVRIGLAFR